MAARKHPPKPELKTFHGTVLVTRAEEWWVEAQTVEEARSLLASGYGHHAAPGERVHIELEAMLEESST